MNEVTAVAIGINVICDIIDTVQARTGVTITPDTLAAYIAERTKRRDELNLQLGVTAE
jgi:hypothetical protein